MDLEAMSLRIAGEYDFKTKMSINAVVLTELARETGLDENQVALALMQSDVHKHIQKLADAVHEEAERLIELREPESATAASVYGRADGRGRPGPPAPVAPV